MTNWIAQLFHQGGMTMFWIEYLAVPGLVIAAYHAYAMRRWSRWTVLALMALILGCGIYGTVDGRARTDDGVARIAAESKSESAPESGWRATPAELESMRAEGYHEANRPIQFAGVAAGALALLFAIGELRRRRGDRSVSTAMTT